MSRVAILGNASGSGTFTIASPNSNEDRTFTLPDQSGTLAIESPINFSFRNKIINGDMRIDQRNAGASVNLTTSFFTLDRWIFYVSQASKLTCQQNAGSVTPPAGFTNYLGVTSSSAYSVTSTDYFFVVQPIEGFNIADLGWGTANAKTVTLSFWVRSSLTGTFSGAIRNVDSTRSYPFSYTITASNTWEQKTITIAGETTGTWLTNNGFGLGLTFCLGSGSTRLSTANSWQAGDFDGVTGTTSVVGTNGATFYITGVQLEVGSVATPFERRPIGMELSLCHRYFYRWSGSQFVILGLGQIDTSLIDVPINFPTTMRAVPTGTFSAGSTFFADTGTSLNSATVSFIDGHILGGLIRFGNLSGLSTNQSRRVRVNNSSTAFANFSAEV
jgi:hypothetical protein